eukprot:gene18826-29059_t
MSQGSIAGMLQALSRAADNLLRSREINAVKSDNSTDEVFEYEWNKPNASADSCVQLVERLVGGLVKDLKSSDSHKVLHAQEDATGVELDFASGYRQETFQSFMEKAMHEKFSSEHVTFPNDQNTKLVLQKLLDAYVDQFNSPTFIVDFPGILSGDGEKEGKRIDLIILKKRVVSVLIVDATVTLKLRAADLARILVNLTDMSEVEQLLPNEWPGLEEIADALEIIQDKVNDWYRGRGLSERKAAYVLSTIGTRLAEYLKSRLDTETELKEPMVWKGPYVTVKQMLELAIGACEKWMHVTRTLTSVDWHEWQGGPHVDPTILALSKRLEEILRLRSTFDQLAQLLTKQELTEMKKKIDAAFDVFTNLQPFDLEVTDAATWSRAVKQFEQRLEPVEQRSAGRLRQELGKVSTNAQALLQGFIRFNDIVKRPMIGAELTSERDNLLAKLSERVNGLKSEFEAKYRKDDLGASELDDRRLQAGRNMPVVVNSLIWARQLRQKIEHVHSSGSSLLSDLTRFEQFSLMCNGLLTELKDYESETFGTWISEIQESIGHVTRDSSSLTLRMEGKIMEISKRDGRLIVNFSERLVELVREVRQLIALGYAVPAAIQKVAQDALRFYRNATVLKQVANFYNTLSGNLIPCTITLLEKPITHFENVVKGKGSKSQISWGDKSEADQYTMKLKDAAEILTKENRKLRRVHDDFIVLVKQLMDIDLVKNIDKWKVVLKEMRSKFTDLERNGYKATGPWKRHWDHQLYKALEYQYLQGLETLNESLPDMPINLCFKQGQIVFDPVFEKVREHYYKNIRDFIAIPVSFKGVGDAEVFKAMAERNEAGIETVFLKTEGLFSRLGKVKRKYKEYVMLGLVDLEQWVELLSEVSDWEKNFKMIKAKGKEIGALEDSIRIDCFIISTIPIKAAIDDQLSRLGQLLNHSLKKSAEKHLLGIETFLTEGIAKLNESPTTLEDIGRANKAYQEMKDQQEPMQRLMKQFDEKSNLYKKLGAFDDLLKAHEQMMEEQIARLRNEVSRDIEKYFAELDGFCVLWKEQKPKDMSALKDHAAISAALQFIKDRQAELDDLAQRGKSVIDQCQYFKLEEPDMGKLKDVKEDVQSLTSVWALYEGFVGEVDEFKEENWFAFRSKAFKFEDFVRDWKEKLKEKPTNDVVIYIRSKLDSWTNMLPLLKFCRGDGMTMDHWTEMFRFLDVDRHEVKPEKLTFGHFIDRSDVICSREKDLKGLHARAQGEIQIREALAEVRAWAHEAEFNLVKGGKSSLIKDWKELLTQVSDNQSLLGSLKDSPYYQGFSGEASSWEQKFVALDEYLHLLMQIQRKWVYLEPIFARGALPAEQPRFRRVDKTFQEIMRDIDADARVIELSKRDLGSSLKSILEQLDRCQKALNEYLEQKRDRFPRFYFIGDDDLLEILGQSQNPVVIQNHLKKLFSGISRVEFDDSKQKIRSIVSSDGEIVPLVNEVTVSAEVESWLSLLDQEMRNTLVDMLWGCVKENDLFKFPSQLLCLSELIHWTQKAHLAIKQRRLPELRESLNERLRAYTRSKNEAEGIVSVLKMKALIMDLIHSIDVIDQLIAEEDVDPQSAVDTWVTKQADSANPQLGQWLNDFFYKAVQMVLDLGHTLSVQTTRMAIVQTGLSHLVGVQSKADFTIGLIRGLGSLLYKTEREDYARNIFDLTGERSPRGNLLDCYTVDGRYVVYEFDRGLQNLALEDVKSGAMVQTVDVQRNFAILRPWLTQGTTRPFLLVGPEGCGKSSSVMAMLEGTKGVKTAVIHCSAQTEGTHIQQKLQQMCTRLSTAEGPALRPKECERLVLLLKDINLPKPDEYGTVQVHSFLQQIILYNGFYDKDLEWIRVENVQVVCTMNPSGSVGRYDLAPRFVAIISVLSMSYPDKESLTFIFTEFLQTLLQSAQLEKTSGGWSSGKGSDLAKVMVNVYEEVKRKWTVDDSSHYVFNPRDITAWILNLLRYDLENNDLAEVVYYEGQRVFADRLTKTDYRRRVAELISEQLSSTVGWRKEGGEKFFTSWLSRGLLQAIEPRDYKKHVNQTLLMHEREIKPLDIVVLPEMLGWIARADRVLSSDGGSMLLCGRSGVGRREVVSLCAYALRMQIFELKVAKNYGLREFTTELKTVLTAAGVQGQHSLLLVEDHNIVSSSFLEIINSLLAGGESPGLFTPEELEPLLAPLKEEASNEGYFGGVYNFFVTRVRKFLHIAVSMDPTNPLYEYRCQSNPSLYTKAQVLWMGTWSSSGMKRVPEMILKDIVRDLQGEKDKDKDKAEKPDDNGKVNGANGPISPRPPNVSFDLPVEALLLHNGVGEQGTPRIFRYLLDNFKRIWNEKVTACDEMRSRLINGLAKLQEAELNVDMLKKDAEEKKTKSSKKQKEADAALTEIQERMEEAKGTKTVTEDQKKTLGKEQKENAKRKAQIEQEIAHIEPVLASAREAVGSIRPEHLTEMRAMPTPPPAIKDVMEGVMRLMDYRETGGDAMKKFLGQRGVKERIINLDARDIRPEIRENVSKLMSQKPLSFKHETIVHASQAAAPLAAWVRAQIEYSTVLEKACPPWFPSPGRR